MAEIVSMRGPRRTVTDVEMAVRAYTRSRLRSAQESPPKRGRMMSSITETSPRDRRAPDSEPDAVMAELREHGRDRGGVAKRSWFAGHVPGPTRFGSGKTLTELETICYC
jgi:hypothetical protein